MISLDKYYESCNVDDDLSTKVCVPIKTKNVSFNTITKINEAKIFVKYILSDCKCKFDRETCNSNQKLNNDKCQCECAKYCTCIKDYCQNPSTSICEKDKYLKGIPDTLVIVCEKIINGPDSVSLNKANTIPKNVTSTMSINSGDKKSKT